MGGFGNVLFQIVAANRLNAKIDPFLTKRNMVTALLGWQIHDPIYDNIPILQYAKLDWTNRLWNTLRLFLSRLLRTQVLGAIWYDQKKEKLFLNSNPKLFAGYFQSKLFLSNSEVHIRELAKQLIFHIKPEKSGTVLHFRWGDSIWARKYHSYYLKVIEELSISKHYFTLVTDDFNAWKAFTLKYELNYSYNLLGSMETFRLMSGATTLYIAPSTFSWWAAHLLSENDLVIIPYLLNSKLGFYGYAKKTVI